MRRIESIDVMRGIAMMIMALDHVRDLLHTTALTVQPTDLNKTNIVLFFTRWITHLYAPTFVFLAGTSAYLIIKNYANVASIRIFLIKRGLLLIVLEFTLISFGLWADIRFNVLLFNVIAAIGFGFILLSFLLKVRILILTIIAISIISLHNLLPLINLPDSHFIKTYLMSLFIQGSFPITTEKLFIMGYPPIPWFGIMLLGYVSGKLFEKNSQERKLIFWKLGSFLIIFCIALRATNFYGDTLPWTVQKDYIFTILSFINLTKYPPSLLYSGVFIGIMFLCLHSIESKNNKFTKLAQVYGKAPLFFFIIHWYLIHFLMFVMVFAQGFSWKDLVFGYNFGRPLAGSGIELWAIYLVWIFVVWAMYPVCKWYYVFKEKNIDKYLLLRYL